jgi:tetratricopeptide (TPR) repeat protein
VTVSFDRAATLRQAEKLLRQGRLDQAIEEYRRLVDAQPRDWTTANQLGDLLGRAGRVREAIEQYTRIADSLAAEGFLPKASALYKKILKLAPHDEHALLQAAEAAAAQRLLADARTFFLAAADQRRARGDAAGVARIVVRLGALDPADIDARMAAARARVELDDTLGAIADLTQLAAELVETERDDDALRPLRAIVECDPASAHARTELARILLGRGDTAAASAYLTDEEAAQQPALAVAAAEMRIRSGDIQGGVTLLDRLLNAGAEHATDLVAAVALELAGDDPDTAYRLVERVADACIVRNDWHGAVQVLQRFSDARPDHMPALTRLVDVCVDAGEANAVIDAQARLVDAYLAAGFASEARYVAEDLVAREPDERAHIERLRRVLSQSGDPDPDRTIADWLAEPRSLVLDPSPERDVVASSPPAVDPEEAPVHPPPATLETPAVAMEEAEPVQEPPDRVEIDLSLALDELPAPAKAPTPAAAAAPPGDIEEVFAHFREDAARSEALGSGELAFQRGKALFEAGALDASIESLRTAAREPARRFVAASLLGRVFQQQHRTAEAIEWLGHAADAPVQDASDRHRVLLQLADLLEQSGEAARALGVCLGLQAEAGDYGDITTRIARLSRGQA